MLTVVVKYSPIAGNTSLESDYLSCGSETAGPIEVVVIMLSKSASRLRLHYAYGAKIWHLLS